LVTFTVFLKDRKIAFGFVLVPAALMIVMPITALILMVMQHGVMSMLGGIALLMVVLAFYIVAMSLKFIVNV